MLLSIITVTYNTGETIRQTIDSVFDCINKYNSSKIEYIVIDGNSTDNTIEILKSYPDICLISEPDKGIYDAMNKGFRKSSGKWIYFINAGDILLDLPINDLNNSNSDLYAFSVENEYGIINPKWGFSFRYRNPIPHQGAFYLRNVFEEYSLKYKIFSDYHHNIVMYKNNMKCSLSNTIVAFHSENGVSNNKKSLTELYGLVCEEFGLVGLVLTWVRFKIIGLINRFK